MRNDRRSLAFLAVVVFGSAAVAALPNPAAPLQAATPPPYASPFTTPPPISATATPSPSGTLVRFSGQLLDVRNGFVYFTTGDGFRLDPGAKIDDPQGGPTTLKPTTRVYARASFDTGSGGIVELALSSKPLPQEATYETISKYAVAISTVKPNPDLKGGPGLNGRPVLVVFTVEVPPKTPFGDAVYVATDVSDWSATAIRMDRVDALHYRVARDFNSGTKFLYRYTRGSWQSSERGQDGLQVPPRQFLVQNLDVQRINNIVYHWADENQTAPNLGGGGIPSPFNPLPFNTPPHH